MRYLSGLAVTLYFLSLSSFASANYEEIASEAKVNSEEKIASYKNELQQYQIKSDDMLRKYKMDLVLNDPNGTTARSVTSKRESQLNNIIVFISFSMPDAAIKQYLSEASKVHASIVIRGLINNSFKETLSRITALVKEVKSGGVQLDPIEFDRFNIKKVPTVVVVSKTSQCFSNRKCSPDSYDSVSGNIGLEAALSEIEKRGNVGRGVSHDAILLLRGKANA